MEGLASERCPEAKRTIVLSATKSSQRVFNGLNDVVAIQDLDNNILMVNDNACRNLGLSREEMVGRKCHELWGNSLTPCSDCPIPTAIETKEPAQVKKQTPDGRWWRIWCRPILNDQGEVTKILEVSEEITETVRAQETQEEVENQLSLILDTMEETFAYFTPELEILWTNKS